MFPRKLFIFMVCLLALLAISSGCSLLPTAHKIENEIVRPELNLPAKDSMLAKHIPSQILVKAADLAVANQIAKDFQGEITGKIEKLNVYKINVDLSLKGSLVETIRSIHKTYNIEYVEPVFIYQATEIPSDSEYSSRQWGPKAMGIENALTASVQKGFGVVIAIADTGVDYNHPEFDTRVLDGYDTFTGNYGREFIMDYYGHGTHVAGIAAANLNQAKMVGIAPQASILPVKVLDDNGGGSDYSIALGIIWAVEHGADVINLSLGGKGYSQAMQDAVDFAIDNEVAVVVAMSNTGKNEVMYPAGCSGVIAVGALDGSLNSATFSTTGRHITLSAPGADIYSSIPEGGYATWNGTSMAAPHIAGAIALLLAEQPALTVGDIQSRLIASTIDLDVPGFDEKTGYGLLDLPTFLNSNAGNLFGHLKVYVELSGMPMADVDVLLQETSTGATVKNIRTNTDGVASFNNISEGAYDVTVNVAGTIKQKLDVYVAAGTTETVNFIEVVPTSIGGYVVDSRGGSGVPGATVTLSGTGGNFTVVSEVDGAFYTEIPAGEYTVSAANPGCAGYRQESVVVAENQMTNVTVIQRPVVNPGYSTVPPSLEVQGLTANAALSGTVHYTVTANGQNAIKLIDIRYGNFHVEPDDFAADLNSYNTSFNTTVLQDDSTFVNIVAYDVNNNMSEVTIPVLIQNGTVPGGYLDAPQLVQVSAITTGQSMQLFREERTKRFERSGKKQDPNIIAIQGIEYDLQSAPPDSTLFVKIVWEDVPYASGYRVYRATSQTGPFTRIADVVGVTNYNDTSSILTIGQPYYYKVTAFDGTVESSASAISYTVPIEPFNVYLEHPAQGATNTSLRPTFTWTKTTSSAQYYKYWLDVMDVAEQQQVWNILLSDTDSITYDGIALEPGKEYEWDIYDAWAEVCYDTFGSAMAISGVGKGSVNGAFTFTTDPEAVPPQIVSLREMDIEVVDNFSTELIPFTVVKAGEVTLETSFYLQNCDTWLELLDSNQTIIQGDDDGADNGYSKIQMNLEPGLYYACVKDYYEVGPVYCHLSITQLQ